MSEEKASHDEPDRGLVDTVSDVFQIREANVAMAIFAVFTVIVGAINMQGWLSVEYHKGLDAITPKSWVVACDKTTTRTAFQDIWQDDESRIVEFRMDDSALVPQDGYAIGMINITISPDTVDGANIADPVGQCDSISASVLVNELTAQWDSERNVLAASDSSCEDILLSIVVYPDYQGETMVVPGVNAYQVLQPWSSLGWGEGVLEVQVDLDVNTAEPGPLATDDDEEITITVEVFSFIAGASMQA